MKIIDNFLEQPIFDKLQTFIMGDDFAWYFNDGIDFDYGVKFDEEDRKKFQFTHIFYKDSTSNSKHYNILVPILQIIDPILVWRIKANLLTRTPNIVENAFHIDMRGMTEEKSKQWTTSIFYVNTNNGYTKFEDGTKIESIANRMVTFPLNMEHTGTSCTDKRTRVVINFNYFK